MSVAAVHLAEDHACLRRVAVLNRRRLRVSIVTVVLFASVVALTHPPEDPRVVWLGRAGPVLLLLGAALRLWALGHISGRKRNMLVVSGPYRHIRHPLYAGSLLMALGAAMTAGSLAAGVLLIGVLALTYRPVIRQEETFLAARFGAAYKDYRARVGCLIPAFQRAPATVPCAFALRHPVSDVAVLLLLLLAVYAVTALMARVHTYLELPGVFF